MMSQFLIQRPTQTLCMLMAAFLLSFVPVQFHYTDVYADDFNVHAERDNDSLKDGKDGERSDGESDKTPPIITLPANLMVEATAVQSLVNIGMATAVDEDNEPIAVGSNAPAFFPLGATMVVWSASDGDGLTSTATQTVTVVDSTAPVINGTPLAAMRAEATGVSTQVMLTPPAGADIFGPVTVTSNAPAGFSVGTTTVTWTASDSNGNTSLTTQVVTVVDTTAPVVTAPVAVTASSGDNLPVAVTLGVASAIDVVDGAIVPTNNAPVTFPVGVTTVTYTATDVAGNIGTATQLVTVNLVDVTAPVVTAPAAVTASSGDNLSVAVTLGVASAIDVVDGAIVPTNDAPVTFPVGVTTVTYRATDAAGNIGTATQLVTVNLVDVTAPVVTAPAAVTASSGDNLPVAVTLGSATATDIVDGAIVATNDAPATFPVGVTTVTYTATDVAGNIGTATQLVTVNLVDVTAPVVTAPIAVTAEATGVTTTVTLGIATATDIVDGVLTTTNDAPATFPVGTTTVTYTATDAAGNIGTATQLVTITDTTAPTVTAPAAVTASSGDNLPVAVTLGSATATDIVDGAIIPTNNAPATFPVGVTTVTYTATDAAGNIGTATQLVTVNLVDVTAPVVTAPVAITVQATGITTPIILGTATANDIVDGLISPTNDAPAAFPVGITTVTYTATDAAGNIGTAAQVVTITEVTSVPSLPLLGGVSVSISVPTGSTIFNTATDPAIVGTPGFSFPYGAISYSVTSAVGGSVTTSITLSSPLPSAFVLFKTDGVSYQLIPQALWSLTSPNSLNIILTDGGPFDLDGIANGTIVDPIVIAVDTLPPVITAPAAVTASSGDNLPVAVTLGSATATDAVDGAVAVTNDAPATFPVGTTTVTYTATDAAGNTATVTQLVTVNLVDATAPVVTAPAAITTEATAVTTSVTLGVATATDAVDGSLVPSSNAPASFPIGITTVTYSATDAAGNIGTATQVVTVTDTTAPTVTSPAAVTADSTDGNPVTIAIGTATATDIFNVTITNDAAATFPVGVTTVTWTATDANGNSATARQLVTVNLAVDMVPPVITVPANVYTSTSTSQASVNIGIASATDNVDGMVAVTNNAPATFPIGVTTVTYTSTDLAGNTATATQNIYVSYSSTVGGGTGGGSGGTTTPPPAGGGATVSSEAVYWHHNDHLGTPQALTDINGTKVWEMSQTPFGIATVNEDPDGDGQLVINNFRFPGQYYDVETGLNYNYFRTFDPALGRYTQSDPIGLGGGMNTFGYVLGDPVNLVDIGGLLPTSLVPQNIIDNTKSVINQVTGEAFTAAELNIATDVIISEVSIFELSTALDVGGVQFQGDKLPLTQSQADYIAELIKRGQKHGADKKNIEIIDIFNRAGKEFKKATLPGGVCPIQ